MEQEGKAESQPRVVTRRQNEQC